MIEHITSTISLNTQTAKDIILQTQDLLKQEEPGCNKHEALSVLKSALEGVLSYLPEPRIIQPDEKELEDEIREEIVIAGANENG